jgi:hypothetical protein
VAAAADRPRIPLRPAQCALQRTSVPIQPGEGAPSPAAPRRPQPPYSSMRSMTVAIPWPTPIHIVASP